MHIHSLPVLLQCGADARQRPLQLGENFKDLSQKTAVIRSNLKKDLKELNDFKHSFVDQELMFEELRHDNKYVCSGWALC